MKASREVLVHSASTLQQASRLVSLLRTGGVPARIVAEAKPRSGLAVFQSLDSGAFGVVVPDSRADEASLVLQHERIDAAELERQAMATSRQTAPWNPRPTSLRNVLLGAVGVFALYCLLFGLLLRVAYWLTLVFFLLLGWFVLRQSMQSWLQSLRTRAQPRHRT